MTRLTDAADTLLAFLNSSPREVSYADSESGTPIDPEQDQYDQCLWFIVTSSKEELRQFAELLRSDPYQTLPPPLMVTVFRLLGLESADEPALLEVSLNGISLYCDPLEEAAATRGIQLLKDSAGTTC